VRWVRQFVRGQAAQGRTVLLSSHLMSEMALTADHVIVLGRGRVLADAGIDELVRSWTSNTVVVRTPRADELTRLIAGPDVAVTTGEPGLLQVAGLSAAAIGDAAAAHGIPLHELTPRAGSLEDAYLALTEGSVEYQTKGAVR
jgi:ABC-2 type transport system ATP-binding protein